jgi:osmotically-inducible protein OsmY
MAGADETAPFPEPSNTWYGPYGARPGVQRSDDDIAADVVERLQDDPRIDPATIGLEVDHGVVTLKGDVDTADARQIAENDVWDVPGVVELRSYLQVEEEPTEGANI